jgi:hypothetical protein
MLRPHSTVYIYLEAVGITIFNLTAVIEHAVKSNIYEISKKFYVETVCLKYVPDQVK